MRARRASLRLEQLQNRQQQLQLSIDLEALQQQLNAAEASYQQLAQQLSEQRKATSQTLSHQVSQAMQQLSMQGGQFVVSLTPCAPSAHGNEKVEFLVAGHQGVSPAPWPKSPLEENCLVSLWPYPSLLAKLRVFLL